MDLPPRWSCIQRPHSQHSSSTVYVCVRVCVCVCSVMSNSFLPMDCSLTGPSVHGIFRQEYWSGLPFPSPEDLSNPGMELLSSAPVGGFFTTEPPGKFKSKSYSSLKPVSHATKLYFKRYATATVHSQPEPDARGHPTALEGHTLLPGPLSLPKAPSYVGTLSRNSSRGPGFVLASFLPLMWEC